MKYGVARQGYILVHSTMCIHAGMRYLTINIDVHAHRSISFYSGRGTACDFRKKKHFFYSVYEITVICLANGNELVALKWISDHDHRTNVILAEFKNIWI